MRKIAMLSAWLCITVVAYSQQDTTDEKDLDEAFIYSNKFIEKKKNLAQKIDILSAKTIARFNGQNTGDLLINSGNVFVQKSQQGGSSPVLRGFEASRVLIIVDGIRLNNAIYRAGHLQNAITIDQNMLERVEVMYGPASTLYGSDALGGVIHLRSKSPKLSGNDKLLTTGAAFARYSSANDEKTMHVDLSLGGKKIAWLQSYNYSYFGDMKMGNNYPDKYPTFGRRDSLIAFFGFKDSVIANTNNRVQKFSGYKQWDVTEKLIFKQNEKVSHLLNFQYSNTTNIPRYDRLQDKRNFGGSIGTTLRYAEWFYGPQKRLLGAYEFSAKDLGFLNEIKANINYQDIEESRQQREYRRYDRFDSRVEKVKVWGFVIDGKKVFGKNELTIGTDGQLNDVKSIGTRTNLSTGAVSKLDTRYPDGKNRMNYFGLYAQHILKINSKWVLNDGLRLQTVSLHSNVIDNSFFSLPVTKFEQNNFAVTGNLGLVYLPSEDTRMALGLSSGFRSPNLDDLVKVFDFSVAKRVYVPNADIDPEYTYNVDLTIRQQIAKIIRFEITGFYTVFRNAIVSAPFKLNGQDSIIYSGVTSAVYANQNVNKASLTGFNANIKIDFTSRLSLHSTISYTHGTIKRFNGTETPQDHIPPVFGKTSFSYQHNEKFSLELYGMYNGWKKIKNYNPDGEDNQQYATADGMPSWFTLNWRGNITLCKKVQAQLGVENILDRNYRYFASGFSAAGRNFIVALRTNW